MSVLPPAVDESTREPAPAVVAELIAQPQSVTVPSTKILAKLHAAMTEMNPVQKDGKHQEQGWRYVTNEEVMRAVHAAFVKAGVVFQLEVVEYEEVREVGRTRNDIPRFLVRVTVNYCFADPDSGETLRGRAYGFAIDHEEKGLAKAVTAATTSVLRTNLLIPVAETDADAEPKRPQPRNQPRANQGAPQRQRPQGDDKSQQKGEEPAINPREHMGIGAAVSRAGLDESEFLQVLSRLGYGDAKTVPRTALKAITDAIKAVGEHKITHQAGMKEPDFTAEEYRLVEEYLSRKLGLETTLLHIDYLREQRRKSELLDRAAQWAKTAQQDGWEKEKGLEAGAKASAPAGTQPRLVG